MQDGTRTKEAHIPYFSSTQSVNEVCQSNHVREEIKPFYREGRSFCAWANAVDLLRYQVPIDRSPAN
jgi:hypothetical protein